MDKQKQITNFLKYLSLHGVSSKSLKYYKSDLVNFLTWAGSKKINQNLISEYVNSIRLITPISTLKRRQSTLRSYANFMGFKKVSSRWKEGTFIHKLLYSRPNWYKIYHTYPLATYIHIAILVLFTSITGYAVYDQVFNPQSNLLAFPSALTRPNRYLSFQGRLTSNVGNPITTATNLVFKLHDAASAGSELWTSGTCSITPDSDGIFSTLLGSSCGSEIAATVFSENAGVWVGVTVAADAEATPRIQIATVAYALNSETLQGYPAGTGTSTIPYIASTGTLVLANASPKIQSTSGTFAVEGLAMTISTPNTSNGVITINPDGTGTLDLTFEGTAAGLSANGFLNATNANITSGALYGGTVASAATGYNFIDFQGGVSPASKFSVSAVGNVTLAGDLTITGGDILDSNGNESIRFGTTASAVNEATLTNAATAGTVLFAATGGDTDIALSIDSKGADALNLNGTGTGDILLGGGAGSTGCTVANATGTLTCTVGITASSIPFSGITSATNTTAAMVVGAGATLDYTSTGTINASSLVGATWIAPGTIGSTTPSTGAFTTLSASTSVSSLVFQGISAATTFGNASYGTTIAGSGLTISPTAWTATPTISGAVTMTSGFDSNAASTVAGLTVDTNGNLTVSNGTLSVTAPSTTGNAAAVVANSLTTGTGLDISSTSTAGGASGVSKMLNIARSGANAQLAHTAYGVYSAVTNTNATSGTNIAGYFSASGATTANYGLIVANGNVGIGTTSPQKLLHLYAGASGQSTPSLYSKLVVEDDDHAWINILTPNTKESGILFGDPENSGAGQVRYIHSSDALTFYTAGSEKVRINTSGNVGIGTVTPGSKLQVNGNAVIGYSASTAGPANGLAISGNVGIGTTGPIFQLEVNGIGQTTAALTDAGVRGGTLSLISNSGTAGMGGALVFGNIQSVTANSTGWAAIKGLLTNGGNNTAGDLAFSTRNASTDVALTERMRILSGGNVGIGTTGPTSLLHVTTTGSTLTDNVNIGGRTAQEAGSALKLSPSIQVVTAAKTNMYGLNISPTFVDNVAGVDITNYSLIYAAPITGGVAGAITNTYGLYVGANTLGTNNYGAYIAGNVGIGTTAPGVKLQVGTTAVSAFPTLGTASGHAALTGSGGLWGMYLGLNDSGQGWIQQMRNDSAVAYNLSLQPVGGNVGIGTTSPLQKLHVVGSCVAGDTLLRIRRRRRKKRNGLESDEDEDLLFDYLLCRIDEILPGDEVLSLNEVTGDLQYAKVNKLMDMDIKEVYELTTKSGKVIRTTAEHPYLTLSEDNPIDSMEKINI